LLSNDEEFGITHKNRRYFSFVAKTSTVFDKFAMGIQEILPVEKTLMNLSTENQVSHQTHLTDLKTLQSKRICCPLIINSPPPPPVVSGSDSGNGEAGSAIILEL
jgi:hypothetical protein